MADRTAIEWTHATWPVVAGCTRASPGCQSCYAIRDSWRMGHNPNPKLRSVYEGTVEKQSLFLGAPFPTYDWSGVVRPLPQRLDWPLRWRRPRRIFVCNMSDLFHERLPAKFIAAVFGIIAATPHHTHQVLTKRPQVMVRWFEWLEDMAERARAVFPDESLDWRRRHVLRAAAIQHTGLALPVIPEEPVWPLPNVWLGVTAENQEMADARIPLLLQVPAAVRFVSVEPQLGPVDLEKWLPCRVPDCCSPEWQATHPRLSWVICGGESGPKARPLHPDWARSLRDQAAAAGVPFFFKQWGEWGEAWGEATHILYPDGRCIEGSHEHPDVWKLKRAVAIRRFGSKRTGHLLDGQEWHQFPEAKG